MAAGLDFYRGLRVMETTMFPESHVAVCGPDRRFLAVHDGRRWTPCDPDLLDTRPALVVLHPKRAAVLRAALAKASP